MAALAMTTANALFDAPLKPLMKETATEKEVKSKMVVTEDTKNHFS